jgi:hypothetical protein
MCAVPPYRRLDAVLVRYMGFYPMSRRKATLVAVACASVAGSLLVVGPAANAAETVPPAKWGTCPADVLASVPPAQQGKFSCATEVGAGTVA